MSPLLVIALVIGMVGSGCSIELDSGPSRPAPLGASDLEDQAIELSRLEVAHEEPVLEGLRLECGYSGHVIASEPGASVHWQDIPEDSVEAATEVVVDHLLANGFAIRPDDGSTDEAGGLYRGSVTAALALDVGDGVSIETVVIWADPERIGALERASLGWLVPNRLMVSMGLEPSGCE